MACAQARCTHKGLQLPIVFTGAQTALELHIMMGSVREHTAIELAGEEREGKRRGAEWRGEELHLS